MNLCPACSEPLDDFSPCACAFGFERSERSAPAAAPEGRAARPTGGMRGMVERKLRHRALASSEATVTLKGSPR